MTENAVNIIITTEINGKAVKREITAEAATLDGEMIKVLIQMLREALARGLETIDDHIRESGAKGWKNLGREKHRVITAVGEVEIRRRVYRENTPNNPPVNASQTVYKIHNGGEPKCVNYFW